MRGWLVGSLLAALGSDFFVLTEARAQDAGTPRPHRAFDAGRRVDINVVAGAEDARELVNTISEVVGRLGLPVNARILEQPPPQSAAALPTLGLARVEVDLTAANAVQVVVYGRGGGVVAMQRFVRNASAPVLREEIADAIRSAVEAQLLIEPEPSGSAVPSVPTTGARNGGTGMPVQAGSAPVPRSPFSAAEPPVAEPPPMIPPAMTPPAVAPILPPPGEAPIGRPSPARWLAVDLAAVAGVTDFANRAEAIPRLGGQVTFAYRKWLNPSIILMGEYWVPFDTSSKGVTYHTSIASMRIVPTIPLFHTRTIALDAGAGAGFDVMNTQPPPSGVPAVMVDPNTSLRTRTDPVLRGLAAAHVALAPRVAVTLNVACDIDVATKIPGYSVFNGGSYWVFLPRRVRPLALLGLTFAVFGEPRLTSGIVQ